MRFITAIGFGLNSGAAALLLTNTASTEMAAFNVAIAALLLGRLISMGPEN